MKNKTLIFIGIGAAVMIVALIIFFSNTSNNQEEEENSLETNNLESLSEAGYPIYQGVSKRKEVQDLQKILINDFGADLSPFGTDGSWGDTTEREVLKYLKTNRFNSLGHLRSILSFVKIGSFIKL